MTAISQVKDLGGYMYHRLISMFLLTAVKVDHKFTVFGVYFKWFR